MIRTLLPILVGICLLLFGRKLFWLLVGAIGFVVGMNFATHFFHDRPESFIIISALVIGLLGAVLAIFLQKVAIGLAGFLAGGYLALNFVERFNWESTSLQWIVVLGAGILSALLLTILFDWALIVLSSLTGALFIVQSFELSNDVNTILFVLLSVAGVVLQAKSKRGKRSGKESE